MRRAAEPAEKDLKANSRHNEHISFLFAVFFCCCCVPCEYSLNFVLLMLILLLLLVVLMNVSGTRDDILMDLSTPLSFDFPRANEFFCCCFVRSVRFGFVQFRPLAPSFRDDGFLSLCLILTFNSEHVLCIYT